MSIYFDSLSTGGRHPVRRPRSRKIAPFRPAFAAADKLESVAWREHPRRSDAPPVETVDVERPLRRLARFRGLTSEARPTMAGISFSVKGTMAFFLQRTRPFGEPMDELAVRHEWVPNGLSTCGGVVEGAGFPSKVSRAC